MPLNRQRQDKKKKLIVKQDFQASVRPQLLVGMIRPGCAVASRRPTPSTKSNGATVADQADN